MSTSKAQEVEKKTKNKEQKKSSDNASLSESVTSDENDSTKLITAARQGNLDAVKEMLSSGKYSASELDDENYTALMWACEKGHLNIVVELLKNGDEVKPSNFSAALSKALNTGRCEIMLKLLKHDDYPKVDVETAYAICSSWTGDWDELGKVLKRKLNVHDQDKNKETVLLKAIKQGRIDVVKMLLKHKLVDVNSPDSSSNTALLLATKHGQLKIVSVLLKEKAALATINFTDKNGNTPLINAVIEGYLDIVEELVDHEADMNMKNNAGDAPLFIAIRDGRLDLIKKLLKGGADVNILNSKRETVLMVAIKHENLKIVSEILKQNETLLNLRATSDYNNTALTEAFKTNNVEIVKELVKHLGVNEKDKDGKTALIWASEHGYTSFVKSLIKHDDLDVTLTNKDELTALDIANKNKYEEIALMLLKLTTKDKKEASALTQVDKLKKKLVDPDKKKKTKKK